MSWNSNNVHTQSGWSQYQVTEYTQKKTVQNVTVRWIIFGIYYTCTILYLHQQIPKFSNIQVEECLVRVRRSEGDNLALQELADVEQEGETQQRADVAHLGMVDILFISILHIMYILPPGDIHERLSPAGACCSPGDGRQQGTAPESPLQRSLDNR